ncbi:hypothetical protein V1283_009023 [Bradyrhizobium sp. AZCC 2262]
MSVATSGAFVISPTPAYRCAHAGYLLRTDLLSRASTIAMRNRDKSTRRQITSDFQKSRQAQESKIFRFTCRANQRHVSARLTRWRGARERHERAVGCDGRGWRAGRCAPEAYGEVVWFGRRGAGVKRAIRSAGDGGKRAVLREEHEVSRKAIAQGRPECSRCPVCSCAFLFAQIARETAGAASTRSSLRPLFQEGQTKIQTSGERRRENAASYSVVIVREGGRSSIPETAMMESIGRGVLDAPPSRGMTTFVR